MPRAKPAGRRARAATRAEPAAWAAWKARLALLAVSLSTIWGVSLYGLAHQDLIYQLALVPRELSGTTGILSMPLVHGSLTHLTVNSSLYLALATLILLRGISYYVLTTLITLVVGGGLLWLVGRDGAHIGASGLIFGFFGLLLTRGIFERNFWSISGSIVVAFLYAGLLRGMVPSGDAISWEGHLTGFLAGILAARLLSAKSNRV